MKFKDLSGKKFNKLTVIEYVGHSKWKCRCECKKISEVSGYALTRGIIKSCGCIRLGTRTENLIGKVFGELEVLSIAKYTAKRGIKRQVKWLCQCSCGKKTSVVTRDLKNGHTKSCGCKGSRTTIGRKNFKNIKNKRYGSLLVIKEVTPNREGRARWFCRCDCGKATIVMGKLLRMGHTKSCGKCRWSGEKRFILDVNTHFKGILHFKHQYSPQYLGKQIHDGYDCKFNIDLEYNGEQHYQPIPRFGGIKQFNKMKRLDKKKRLKCRKAGVSLFEFRAERDDLEAFIEDIEEYLVYVCRYWRSRV